MIELPISNDGARRSTPVVGWRRSPARPALEVASALDRVRRAPTILPAMRLLPDVLGVVDESLRAGARPSSLLAPLTESIGDADTVTALTAVHALARIPGSGADAELTSLLLSASRGFEEHAAWASNARPSTPSLIDTLALAVARGGTLGMHAQGTLVRWAASERTMIASTLTSLLDRTDDVDGRRYLVETIGLIGGPQTRLVLERVARDPAEPTAVRVSAVAAFVERLGEPLPRGLAGFDKTTDELADAVRTARTQRRLARRGPRRSGRRHGGVRVAHLHLGETGGLVGLLPQLGRELAERKRVAETTTILRAGVDTDLPRSATPGHSIEHIELERGEGASFTGRWPSVVAAERGIRAAFLAGDLPDVIHLRMADPGSLAGANVARQLGIPLVFTLAADPHGPIAAAESAGTLDRRTFAREDAHGALWFRTSLVERLATEARELAVFPRPEVRAQLRSLTGIDIHHGRPRTVVVPEGIDVTRADDAQATVSAPSVMPEVIADLQGAISRLPVERHGLPLVTSVGRLHEVKGMARLVQAFAVDADLARRANLVIVGGDLADPSAAEAAELSHIRQSFDRYPGLQDRIVLLGHRSHQDVALVLAATRSGWGSLVAPAGAYACGSAKEEFGLAIVEAMAAGLPVAVPHRGGPATYVEEGASGFLADTLDPVALGSAARAALDLSADPATSRRSRAVVDRRYTLERMARILTAVYRVAVGASSLAVPVDEERESA